MDINDPPLAFTSKWVEKISREYDKVFIITLKSSDNLKLSKNIEVYPLYAKSKNKLLTIFKFYKFLFKIIISNKIDRCFCHMNPLFLAMTFGILRVFRIKTILWYTHPSITFKLRLASNFANRIISASENSFPLKTNKFSPIGHAIDTDVFFEDRKESKYISFVGRISRVKNIDTLIKAYSLLINPSYELLIIGDSITLDDFQYEKELKELINKSRNSKSIKLKIAVSRNELKEIFNESFLHVNLTRNGSFDKANLEAMACGTISVSSNKDFKKIYENYSDECSFKFRDSTSLYKKIKHLQELEQDNFKKISNLLKQNTIKYNSLNTIGERINAQFEKIQ
jgi:glycosyltransferase involved in cell wall biosynthesis